MDLKRGNKPLARQSGFTLIELLIVLGIVVLLVSLLLPALFDARKSARAGICESNLRQMMVAHFGYSEDFKSYIAALNGRAEDSMLNFFPGDMHLAAQAQQIIADLSGRGTGTNGIPLFQSAGGTTTVTVIEQFSHVVLNEYLNRSMPLAASVCPEDRPRLSWRAAPLAIASSPFKPRKDINVANLNWWPYSASYQLTPYACAGPWRNSPGSFSTTVWAYAQANDHDLYHTKYPLGGQKIDQVSFPSQKVALFDTQQRHVSRKDLFFAYPDARQPLSFFDGSVSMRKTGNANKGENPDRIVAGLASQFVYNPDLGFESPIPSGPGRGSLLKAGYYRWTRGELGGVDFGGQEVSK